MHFLLQCGLHFTYILLCVSNAVCDYHAMVLSLSLLVVTVFKILTVSSEFSIPGYTDIVCIIILIEVW
jgi:hypothetical protein